LPRAYSPKLVALALAVPIKWIDNLLSHHPLPGVRGGRQGVQRQIGDDGLLAIEIVRLLTAVAGVSSHRAVELATNALQQQAPEARLFIHGNIAVVIKLADIRRRLRDQVTEAAEAVSRVRRGRPRASRTDGDGCENAEQICSALHVLALMEARWLDQPAARATFSAAGPFAPCTRSNSTASPSASVLNPLP
jgi:hypothetical protein